MAFREGAPSFEHDAAKPTIAAESKKLRSIERLKRVLALGLMAGAIGFSSEFYSNNFSAEAKTSEAAIDSNKREKDEKKKYNKVTEKKFIESLQIDTAERMALQTELDNVDTFTELPSGNQTSGRWDFDDIQRQIDNGAKEITMIHSHPKKGYELLVQDDPEELEQIQKGEREFGPMPPSLLDYNGAIDTKNHFSKHTDVRFTNRVYDAQGNIWQFKVTDSESLVRYQKMALEIKEVFSNLQGKELKLINQFTNKDIDPRFVLQNMEKSNDAAARALEQSIQAKMEAIVAHHQSVAEEAGTLELAAAELTLEIVPKGESSPQWKEMIQKYIQRCKAFGIEVTQTRWKK